MEIEWSGEIFISGHSCGIKSPFLRNLGGAAHSSDGMVGTVIDISAHRLVESIERAECDVTSTRQDAEDHWR